MGRVRILPEVLSHQIAAGEIVERPASVVKELVENSLDAGAGRIEVEVESGGKRRIVVRDDGIGMSSEDAALALEHHATSKISRLEDLKQIETLGFRGEALPSIASVSRLRLRTVEKAASGGPPAAGVDIEIVAGRQQTSKAIAWPEGTEISVEDLFFNVPARRKFLKADSTELSHVSRQVTQYALSRPDVEFVLRHGSRSLLSTTRVDDLQDRIFEIYGEDYLNNLVPLNYRKEGIEVSGFASLPHEQRNNGNSLYLFVNRRSVRDRILVHAIRFAYQDLIPSSSYPVIFLFVKLAAERIDVNVHPTKTEIRFRDAQSVHSAIQHAIEEALLTNKQGIADLARDFSGTEFRTHDVSRHSGLYPFRRRLQTAALAFAASTPPVWAAVAGQPAGGNPHAGLIPETAHLAADLRILGQFVESFIVAADREGVLLVDQHVAHERILYDRALSEMTSAQGVVVQKLLLPETLELTPQQLAVSDQLVALLNENGFEVDPFGGKSLVVRGVPALAPGADASLLVESILSELQTLDRLGGSQASGDGTSRRLQEKLAISLACRAAIKINTPLSLEKMEWLLDELMRCDNPYTCPHGRPIVLRLNIEEVLKSFKRI